jgi:hypothetical protein
MDISRADSAGTEDDRWLVALAGVLSAVAGTVELTRRHVARSLGKPLGPSPVTPAADVVIGVAVGVMARAVPIGRTALAVLRPVATLASRPPLVPERFQPITWLRANGRTGSAYRNQAATPLLENLVPAVAAGILDRIDITGMVVDRVDIDRIIAEVDVNGVLERVDMDSIVARLDLDSILDRVDINSIVATLDLDSIVARVDLDAIATRLDIDAILDRVDLAALARQVIDDIDLPEIIRESTGIMTSEAVIGARMQGIRADDGVNRVVDRLLLRRGEHKAAVPGDPGVGDETAD